MRHPAFDTETDTASRKAASQKKKELEKLKKQSEAAKKVAATAIATQLPANEAAQAVAQNAASQVASQLSAQQSEQTPSAPVISAEVQQQISAVQQAQQAQRQALSSTVDADKAADAMNAALSAAVAPVYSALEQFKKIPPMLRSLVDVQGAAAGMYSSFDDIAASISKITTTTTSSEVPITLKDYQAEPSKYPRLESLQKMRNNVTEADCASSGYKKVVVQTQQQAESEPASWFTLPEYNDIAAKSCEKMINSTLKAAWSAVAPPIQMIAGIANVGPIGPMVTAVTDMINGIGQIATTEVPEDKLNQKIKETEMANAAAIAEADAAKSQRVELKPAGAAAEDAAKKAEQAQEDLKKQADAAKSQMSDAFSKLQMPPMPDGIDESIEDLWKSLQMVVSNIQNIFIVIVFKLIDCIFKCFNEIIGILGVPNLPYPLNIIPQLVPMVINIMMFIMTLPMSLYSPIKAMMARKAKATVVANQPTPPKPVPTIEPVAPTSDDVPKVDATWADVTDALVNKWKFSAADAAEIVQSLQVFWDGSGDNGGYFDEVEGEYIEDVTHTKIISSKNQLDSQFAGYYDFMPKIETTVRIRVLPQYALEQFIPQSLQKTADGKTFIKIPVPYTPLPNEFYMYVAGKDGTPEKKYMDMTSKKFNVAWQAKAVYAM